MGDWDCGGDWDGDSFSDFPREDDDPQDYCSHEWVKYEGITERYYFCKKCDKKRPLED
jgi:hypothetical protein